MSVAVVDPTNMYRTLRVVGEVVSVAEDVGYVHIDALTKVYDGLDHFPDTKASDYTRYKLLVEPKRVWSRND